MKLFTENRKEAERELRRYENRLFIIGTGVAAFGLWTFLRFIMECYTENGLIQQIIDNLDFSDLELETDQLYTIIIVVMLVIAFFIAAMQFDIGLSARKDITQPKKKRIAYLILNSIYILFYIYNLQDTIIYMNTYYPAWDEKFDAILEMLINLTVVLTMVELEISAIYVKVTRKRLAQTEVN